MNRVISDDDWAATMVGISPAELAEMTGNGASVPAVAPPPPEATAGSPASRRLTSNHEWGAAIAHAPVGSGLVTEAGQAARARSQVEAGVVGDLRRRLVGVRDPEATVATMSLEYVVDPNADPVLKELFHPSNRPALLRQLGVRSKKGN